MACPVADGRHQRFDSEGNTIACDAGRVPAREAEGTVVAAVMEARLAPEEIDALSDELRRRLASPTPGTSDKEGRPLLTAGDYAVAPPDGSGDAPVVSTCKGVEPIVAALREAA